MLAHFRKKKAKILLYKDGIILWFHTSSGLNHQSYLLIIAKKEAQRNYSKTEAVMFGNHSITFY